MVDYKDPAWLADERQWCERAKRGDQRAFTHLYRSFAKRLYGSVVTITRNPAVAEDIVVETFRVGFARIGEFDTRGDSVWFWLHTIAKNKAIDASRSYDSSQEAFEGFRHLLDASELPDVDRMLDWPKLQARVRAVLAKLGERHRRAVELRFFEELSSQRAGEALGVNPGTFDVTLSRALDQFRKIWLLEGGAP